VPTRLQHTKLPAGRALLGALSSALCQGRTGDDDDTIAPSNRSVTRQPADISIRNYMPCSLDTSQPAGERC
jgi:hypothetical protein